MAVLGHFPYVTFLALGVKGQQEVLSRLTVNQKNTENYQTYKICMNNYENLLKCFKKYIHIPMITFVSSFPNGGIPISSLYVYIYIYMYTCSGRGDPKVRQRTWRILWKLRDNPAIFL